MNEAVCCEDVLAEEVELGAVGVGDEGAGFGGDEAAGGDVPGFKTVFPKDFDLAGAK